MATSTDATHVTTQQDIRPVPDPTVLTTAASVRLEETMRDLIQSEITHQRELFEMQLRMLETRTAEQKKDTKDALDAALAAAKEQVSTQNLSFEKSITKSETATTERIKALETLLGASTKATDDKTDDLKSRIVAIEAVKLGVSEGTTTVHQGAAETRATLSSIISVVLAVIAVGSILIAILKP
jgi:L-lactate utilization protein LutC